MLQKLIADRLLTLPAFDQSTPPANPAFPANFVPAPNRIYNIHESTNVGSFFSPTRSSQVTAGAHAQKTHRTFRWLPWVKGQVSCVPLAGGDILTGKMSGCWLVIFQLNGATYAGHIGTEDAQATPNSVQAKAAWRNAVNANQIAPMAAFNPVGTLPATSTLNLKNEAAEFYGAFEPTGQVYTVVMTHAGTSRRIARVLPRQTTPDVVGF
ncbi:MAG TPA: hypothetical protein VKC35_02225 [Vicinamibacterales bacterium]|nr:hypothetical protein [Vicinamibacterales bacterium]